MRIVFMGTPPLAAKILRELAAKHQVVGVYTRPDAVRGRGNKLVASPVKVVAEELGIPVFTAKTLKGDQAVQELKALQPDFACVSACSIILPQEILDVPTYGCLNVHASLLPRWRGAAPIERAILADDEVTGVCIMRMETGLDVGDYCARVEVPVNGAYADDLTDAIAQAGAKALLDSIDEVAAGKAVWTPQSQEGVTYASKLEKAELALDPEDAAWQNVLKVHASSDAHPARARVEGKSLSVERAELVQDEAGLAICADLQPGQALFASKRLFMGTPEGAFELLQVKPDGKKSMDARSFAGGIQGAKGKRLSWGRA